MTHDPRHLPAIFTPATFSHAPPHPCCCSMMLPFSNCSSSGTGRGPLAGGKANVSSSMKATSPFWDEESSEKILGFALKKGKGHGDGHDGDDSDSYADDIMTVQDDRIPADQVGAHARTRASCVFFFAWPVAISLTDSLRVRCCPRSDLLVFCRQLPPIGRVSMPRSLSGDHSQSEDSERKAHGSGDGIAGSHDADVCSPNAARVCDDENIFGSFSRKIRRLATA